MTTPPPAGPTLILTPTSTPGEMSFDVSDVEGCVFTHDVVTDTRQAGRQALTHSQLPDRVRRDALKRLKSHPGTEGHIQSQEN